ncbi:MAG: acyltransferase [Actinomycetota bacterium]|jgi:peptidoglycan/LPS O-acetylase OafA/YrhL|nr:acyltransferase [Actinomycetota bacterium]
MGRNPALDGLRAMAMLMVVGYHIDNTVVPAGHWGVTLFFVLSGYLITGSLCAEMDRTGRIDLRSFYLKRGLRLVPALLAVCVVMLALGAGWSRVVPAIGFNANYARIEGVDLGRLTHTWFIAVIIHFYLLWPIVIGAIPARHRRRIIGVLTVAAIVWRAVAIGIMSPGWVYNATDTNAAALLVGCCLAVAPPPPRGSPVGLFLRCWGSCSYPSSGTPAGRFSGAASWLLASAR